MRKHKHTDDDLEGFAFEGKKACQRMQVREMQDDEHLSVVAKQETCCEDAADAFFAGAKEMRRHLAPTSRERRAQDELHASMGRFQSQLPPWAKGD